MLAAERKGETLDLCRKWFAIVRLSCSSHSEFLDALPACRSRRSKWDQPGPDGQSAPACQTAPAPVASGEPDAAKEEAVAGGNEAALGAGGSAAAAAAAARINAVLAAQGKLVKAAPPPIRPAVGLLVFFLLV